MLLAENLFSAVSSHAREILQFLESKMEAMSKAADGQLHYDDLLVQTFKLFIWTEYRCWNFEKVIEIHNEVQSRNLLNSDVGLPGCSPFVEMIQLGHELALIKRDRRNIDPSFVSNYILQETKNGNDLVSKKRELVINALRASKKFNAVIDLAKNLLLLPNLPDPASVKMSLLVTYIERYRVEYDRRSKKEDYFLIRNLFCHIVEKYSVLQQSQECSGCEYPLALAQWTYLCHKLSKDGPRENYRMAILGLEKVVESKWKDRDYCTLCDQAPTDCEVKLVCSECRVTCYCSIGHQRLCWKKDEVKGICFGHEVFCPLMRAYRIKEEALETCEIKQKTTRRFKNECLRFLAYGLKLEDKCFVLGDLL